MRLRGVVQAQGQLYRSLVVFSLYLMLPLTQWDLPHCLTLPPLSRRHGSQHHTNLDSMLGRNVCRNYEDAADQVDEPQDKRLFWCIPVRGKKIR